MKKRVSRKDAKAQRETESRRSEVRCQRSDIRKGAGKRGSLTEHTGDTEKAGAVTHR